MKIVHFVLIPFLLAMVLTVAAFSPMALTACTGSTQTQLKTGGVAAGACSFDLLMKYGAQVNAALAKEGWEQALADVAKTNNIAEDALICLVQGVAAVLTAPSGSASTSQPEPAIIHAREYLAKHGAK